MEPNALSPHLSRSLSRSIVDRVIRVCSINRRTDEPGREPKRTQHVLQFIQVSVFARHLLLSILFIGKCQRIATDLLTWANGLFIGYEWGQGKQTAAAVDQLMKRAQ